MTTNNLTDISLQASKDGTHADVYLLGVIGDWWEDNTASAVIAQMSNPKLKTVDIYLSSVGGGFFDGLPICNAIEMHAAYVTVYIIGYALSMGSVIPLHANRVLAAENAILMIHNAQGYAGGDYRALEKSANILKKHSMALMPRYMKRMNKSEAEVQALLDAETWYNANEAKEAGLIDGFIQVGKLKDDKAVKAISNHLSVHDAQFAQSHFKNIPSSFSTSIQNCINQDKPLINKVLDKMVGTNPVIPSPTLNTKELPIIKHNIITNKQDDPVTQEEIQAIVDAVTKNVTANVIRNFASLLDDRDAKAEIKAEATANQAAADKALAETQEKLKVANARLSEFNQPAYNQPVIPVNNGPVGTANTGAMAASNTDVSAI
jgi:ATP-dependent protease ClpP protease subunit